MMPPFLWLILVLIGLARGIKVTKISVPSTVLVGDSVKLECHWAPKGKPVYSVKWYLGLHEFYRWSPSEQQRVQIFPVEEAFTVDTQNSYEGTVVLRGITLKAAGRYRCEVSGEAPSFPTDEGVAAIAVVDPPSEGPFISGLLDHYQPRQQVLLNCSSAPSIPAAALSFYVNEEPVDHSWLIHYDSQFVDGPDGAAATVLGMSFPLRERLLVRGRVRVKCTASIANVYYESTEAYVESASPHHASILEDRMNTGSLGYTSFVVLLLSWALTLIIP